MLTGQRATAEDIAQEVLIRAHSKWHLIGSLDNPEAYVRKMMLNELAQYGVLRNGNFTPLPGLPFSKYLSEYTSLAFYAARHADEAHSGDRPVTVRVP